MRSVHTISASVALLSLAGCSTRRHPPPDWTQFTNVVHRGVIVEKDYRPAYSGTEPSNGMYRTGMGGAVGGAAAGLFAAVKPRPGAQPAYFSYTLRLKGEPSEVRVAYVGELPVGACVEVLTDDPKATMKVYNYGTAVLRPAAGCE